MSPAPSAPRLVFLVPPGVACPLAAAGPEVDPDAHPEAFLKGWSIWSLLTGLVLRRTGRYRVAFDVRPHPDAINVGLVDTLKELGPAPGCFSIGLQGDRNWALPGLPLTVVQNRRQASADEGRHWLPIWPQPGLQPRSPQRDSVRTVGYAGSFRNLALLPHVFAAACRRCGLEPRMALDGHWHECAELDILVGIRSFDTRTHDLKPPSKLVNAWLADIPFVGGWDSAFSQTGEPGRDYLRVATAAEFEQALDRLRTDPEIYSSLVAAGRRRAPTCDRAAVTAQWLEFLERVALPRYEAWRTGAPAAPSTF